MLSHLNLSNVITEMLAERDDISLSAALFAVILGGLYVEIQMPLILPTVVVAITKQTFSDNLGSAFSVFDTFAVEVLDNCNCFHIN